MVSKEKVIFQSKEFHDVDITASLKLETLTLYDFHDDQKLNPNKIEFS